MEAVLVSGGSMRCPCPRCPFLRKKFARVLCRADYPKFYGLGGASVRQLASRCLLCGVSKSPDIGVLRDKHASIHH
jgi:hypothetical protein